MTARAVADGSFPATDERLEHMMMRPTRRAAAVGAILALGLSGTARGAYAADDTSVDLPTVATTGGDVSGPGDEMPPAEQERAALKFSMAQAYQDTTLGASPRRLARAVRAFGASSHLSQTQRKALVRLGAKASMRALGGPRAGARVATTQRLLPLTHEQELYTYFCGPATGVMIMRSMGRTVSAYNGVALSQGHMAGPAHMNTANNGVTSWSTRLFTIGADRWMGGTDDGWYVQVDSPSPSQFQSALSLDIDSAHPFAADTVEFTGGAHYNNHPDHGVNIGHWLTIYGYGSSGATTYFADPATYWAGVAPTFTANSDNFVNKYMQYNGMAW